MKQHFLIKLRLYLFKKIKLKSYQQKITVCFIVIDKHKMFKTLNSLWRVVFVDFNINQYNQF